ncbi:hypothetical protein [Clostridium sp. CF012]|nr:hypothetical protein [Clostridium sp. CF012]
MIMEKQMKKVQGLLSTDSFLLNLVSSNIETEATRGTLEQKLT